MRRRAIARPAREHWRPTCGQWARSCGADYLERMSRPMAVGQAAALTLALFAGSAHAAGLQAQDTAQSFGRASSNLAGEIRRIGQRTGGTLTVAVVHLQSGELLSIDGATPVFMSSVVKLPLAVQLLARVDRGELRLDDTITIGPRDLSPGYSPLAESHPRGGSFTVRELLRRAVSESDNTANDALLRYSGGPKRATAQLRRLDVHGVRIDRYYTDYLADYVGAKLPPRGHWSRALFDTLSHAVSEVRRDAAADRFLTDSRDRTTADAMIALLARLHRGHLLGRETMALLLRYMTESRNPPTRLIAGVPRGTTSVSSPFPMARAISPWRSWCAMRRGQSPPWIQPWPTSRDSCTSVGPAYDHGADHTRFPDI
jgi:beta-lactamase class A